VPQHELEKCGEYLHEEDVLVAVVPQHVVVYLGHDPVPVLPVKIPVGIISIKGTVSSQFYIYSDNYNRGIFLRFFHLFHVQYSTLLHLPPLRFHCVGGCWN